MRVPKIFFDLSARSNKMAEITPDDVHLYVSSLDGETTFISEVIAIIGVENFLSLVSSLGGQRISLPTPEKIFKEIQSLKKESQNDGK